jgi:hypothetical protein
VQQQEQEVIGYTIILPYLISWAPNYQMVDHGEETVPKSYPNDYPVGILVKNEGDRIRYFKTQPPRIVLKQSDYGDDLYEIYYMFNWTIYGTEVKFDLSFESNKGIKTKQTWRLVVGNNEIKRIKPK